MQLYVGLIKILLKVFHYSILTVIGALIGKQKGRNIEVMNSFELVFSVIDGDIVIDRDYYNLKEEQCMYCSSIIPRYLDIPYNS